MRLIAYIRVSKVGGREGHSFQSPAQQRAAIHAIVSLTAGAAIVDTIEDLDESGGTMERPGVQRAIAMVESGQADGIVCAYLDRWARTMEALEMIERWTRQGKTFISARERFDAGSSAGRFTLGMMLLVAKYYRDVITERWEISCRNAIERGVHVTVPYGYRRGQAPGRPHRNGGTHGAPLAIHHTEAAVVRRIFAERIKGAGIADIAHRLNRDGIRSPDGGQWTRQTVRAILRVRAYVGEAYRGELIHSDAHPAIVSVEEWERVQTERGPSRHTGNSLLAGLVRCAGCGYVMGPSSSSHGGRRYNCNRHHAALDCPSPTTAPADTLEELVVSRFLDRYGHGPVDGGGTSPAVEEASATVERVRLEYQAWRDDVELRSLLGSDEYRSGLIARKHALDESERGYGDAVRQSRSDALSVDEAAWESLDTAGRRELLQAGLDAVVIRRARSTHAPMADRVTPLWAGELDSNGSRSGLAAAVRGRP
jgi:site-specific DNA recombinase